MQITYTKQARMKTDTAFIHRLVTAIDKLNSMASFELIEVTLHAYTKKHCYFTEPASLGLYARSRRSIGGVEIEQELIGCASIHVSFRETTEEAFQFIMKSITAYAVRGMLNRKTVTL